MLQFPFKYIIPLMVSIMQGWNPEEFDPVSTCFTDFSSNYLNNFQKLIPISISQHPRSYPWKLFYHYVQQFMAEGRFQMYDYGPLNNIKLYGTEIPPEYPINKIITPTFLIYSDDDSIATTEVSTP